MKTSIKTIGLGGGCHWCTEAVFQSVRGVVRVEQGYIAAKEPYDSLSEGILVHHNEQLVSLDILIDIHLRTHKSTSQHSMRDTYRSAIYALEKGSFMRATQILKKQQATFDNLLVTKVLHFKKFEPSREEITDYYVKDPNKPFCQRYIQPKLEFLAAHYDTHLVE